MAEKTLKLEVITPDRVVFSDKSVVSVVIPGSEGYFGVMANHAAMMAEMTVGHLDYRRADGTTDELFIGKGFVLVYQNAVTVLSPSAELCSEIDLERAEKALARAKERIHTADSSVDEERAQSALQRALMRLRVAQHTKG